MWKSVGIAVFSLVLCSVLAKPPTKDQLDKATAEDIAVNVVTAEKKSDNILLSSGNSKEGATIDISGISTGEDPLSVTLDKNPPTQFKPQRAGTMFARLIDDIFQIPISVLTNVAKLITNPFTQNKKTPEDAVSS